MDAIVSEAGWKNEAFEDGGPGKMLVFFYSKPVKHNFKSAQEKRPIFVDKIFIKKLVPGDNKLAIDRPMREKDAEEYPIEWARFEQKKANLIVGTPIEAWSILSDIQKAEFKALNIFTIDQFANLPDSAGSNIMGFNDFRAKARAFIMASANSAAQGANDERDKKIADLEAKLAAVLAQPKPAKKKKHKREMSPEARQALSDRMKQMHADKAAAKVQAAP